MVSTSTAYHLIANNLDRSLEIQSKQPSVALESAYYLKNIGNIKSIDDFLKDTRLFNFAMKAFGLEDMAYAKGLVRKMLTDGVDDSSSLANRIDDPKFLAFAKTFNFKRDGEAATSTTAAQQGVVDMYVRQTLEVASGTDDEGVRLALYFQRMAPTITSFYAILADPALTQVVKTALGLPDAMASADIDEQVAALSARMSLDDLKDPAKLDKFITRFAAAYDATDTSTADPILALFDNSTTTPTLDLDLIMTLKNLKYGGG